MRPPCEETLSPHTPVGYTALLPDRRLPPGENRPATKTVSTPGCLGATATWKLPAFLLPPSSAAHHAPTHGQACSVQRQPRRDIRISQASGCKHHLLPQTIWNLKFNGAAPKSNYAFGHDSRHGPSHTTHHCFGEEHATKARRCVLSLLSPRTQLHATAMTRTRSRQSENKKHTPNALRYNSRWTRRWWRIPMRSRPEDYPRPITQSTTLKQAQ